MTITCKEIADDSKALQDSLEKTIELVKSGKIKAKLADLQAACVKNVAFMNKLAPALAQCQGLSEPNLRDPKSCGPCADPWDMMPTNIVFVCNEAMNKVFGVESTSLLLPPDGDDNPQTENTSPQVATKSLFFEVQTGCDTDEKLTHVYTTTNSLGERFEYTACKLGDVTYFHYKGGEYWYYKGQYYKSNDHYNQTKQRIEQGFEMYNWSTRTYDYVNLPIGKLTLEQLADALGEFYYSTFGGMAGAEAGLVLDVLNNVYIQTDLSCKGTIGDSYRSCLVSTAPKEFAKMVALGTLAVGVYKSANFIWNKSVNILKLGSGGALNLVEKFKSLNTSKVRPPAFENKAYAEFLDDFAGNIKDFEGSVIEKHPNWIEVLDIRTKIIAKKTHVLEIEGLNKTRNYNGIRMKGFTGCHSTQALSDYVSANGGTYRINGKPTNLQAGEVFEGQPIITLNGQEYVKTNGQPIVEYSTGKYGGTSTFFPENWNNSKILDEVEYAIANNHGVAPGNNPSEFFGFSQDGKVEIHFYLNNDGTIGSYFPKKR